MVVGSKVAIPQAVCMKPQYQYYLFQIILEINVCFFNPWKAAFFAFCLVTVLIAGISVYRILFRAGR